MGNDLYVIVNGENVANIGRKHNYTFYGEQELPTEEEIEKTLADTRQHIASTITSYAMCLACKEETPPTEFIDDIVTSVKDLLDLFEYEILVAGRNFTIGQLTDEFGEENVEVIDDGELERRRQLEEKFVKAKKEFFADLRERIKKVNWDAVEDQTGEVDLEPVELVRLAQEDAKNENEGLDDWEEENNDYLDRQNRQ